MPLEKGIAELVAGFIAAGRPSSREQNIDDRRAGYIASTTVSFLQPLSRDCGTVPTCTRSHLPGRT